MARCGFCGSTILFGGIAEHGLRFCDAKCHQDGFLLGVADKVPADVIAAHVAELHAGSCPKCGGPGPVDVHTSYRVWSALVMTSWQNLAAVSCRRCGNKARLKSACISAVAGWWGVPWGLVMTPIYVIRNLAGLGGGPPATNPSPQLEKVVRVALASRIVQQAQAASEPE